MIFAQEKGGQKLHLVYELPTGGVSQPICGRIVDRYRMTINLPLGNACKNCMRRIKSKNFNEKAFLKPYFE